MGLRDPPMSRFLKIFKGSLIITHVQTVPENMHAKFEVGSFHRVGTLKT